MHCVKLPLKAPGFCPSVVVDLANQSRQHSNEFIQNTIFRQMPNDEPTRNPPRKKTAAQDHNEFSITVTGTVPTGKTVIVRIE